MPSREQNIRQAPADFAPDRGKPLLSHEFQASPLDSESGKRLLSESAVVPTFEVVYAEWFEHVARWVRALGGPEADCDDLVQDVFLVVHRRLADFDGQNIAGWLYQIARRKVRDFRRLLWVKHFLNGNVALHDGMLQTARSPLDNLESTEKAKLLEHWLGGLNADQRAAFVLFEIEGCSGEEIARVQNVPINTVWARIHKARKKLHERAARHQGLARRGALR